MKSAIPRKVTNSRLIASKIPGPAATWDEIQRFALTFDGYAAWPEGVCAEIANARRCSTLTELRTCLFFEQRRWRHYGYEPNREAMEYIYGILEQIRHRVVLANQLLK